MELKFAKCNYASFDNSIIELKLNRGDVFAVTPKIENSKVFTDSINTKNFVIVDLTRMPEFVKVVNKTPAMKKAFKKQIEDARQARVEASIKAVPDPPKSTPLPDDLGVKPQEKPEEKVDEAVGEAVKKAEDDAKSDDAEEDKGDDASEDEGDKADTPEPKPDVDAMNYRELQTFAEALEDKYEDVEIDRSVKTAPLRKAIKKVLEEKAQ